MQDILATILLVAIVVAAAVSIYTFTSSTLTNLFTSSETTFQLTLPLRIEKTLVQGTQTCFIVRNPNDESIDTNTIAIYINGRLYTHTSDCNQVLPKSICRLCVQYTPSGGEEVKISTGGGTPTSFTVPSSESNQPSGGSGGGNVVFTWAKAFGGTNDEEVFSIQQTSDGGYIVAGYTYSYGSGGDALILKLNSNCNIQWAKTYGGTEYDEALSIQQTSDGGYIVAGYTGSYGSGSADFLILKLDSNGSLQWAKTFGGINWDVARSIQQTSDGGYIVVGRTDSYGSGSADFLILKLDSNGSLQWVKTFGGAGYDRALSVQQTSDGKYVVAGETSSYGSGNEDFLILKLDSNGSLQWSKTFGEINDDIATSIQQTSDGGYIVAGYTGSYGSGSADFLILKLDSNGSLQWSKTFGDVNSEIALSIQQTSDGGYIAAGTADSYGSGLYDFLILKLDSNGSLHWSKTFGGIGNNVAYSIQQTSDGGYIVAGYTTSYGSGNKDFLVLKLDQNGNIPGCSALQDVTPSSTSPSVTVIDITATIGISDITATIGSTSPSVTVQDVTPNETNVCG